MVSSPEELGLNEMIPKNMELFYETIARAVFRNAYVRFYENIIWNEFWANLSKGNKAKVVKVCHFYYYMCLPFKESYEVPDAKRLVFTASIMESLMGEDSIELGNFLMKSKFKAISNPAGAPRA